MDDSRLEKSLRCTLTPKVCELQLKCAHVLPATMGNAANGFFYKTANRSDNARHTKVSGQIHPWLPIMLLGHHFM